jgi:hypothetical protein
MLSSTRVSNRPPDEQKATRVNLSVAQGKMSKMTATLLII